MRRTRDGHEVVVFATGSMVARAVDTSAMLETRGIFTRVVNDSTVKPIPGPLIVAETQGMSGVVTAEEHSVIGGLGCAITSVLRGSRLPIKCVGIRDRFGTSAENYAVLMEQYGLATNAIAEAVRNVV